MSHKTRLWIGVTLIVMIVFNYFIYGYPLLKKRLAIKRAGDSILIRQVKGPGTFKGSDEEYVLEILRKEKAAIDRKINVLNCIALSGAVIVISWTAFGLIFSKKK